MREKIWYPFSQEKHEKTKIHIYSANGEFLYDKDGKKYVDLISSWWTNSHGHCNKYISDKIISQIQKLDHVMFSDFIHDPVLQLAENLDNITHHNFAKFFFSDNGSTSIEVALKIAHQYWKNKGFNDKNKIISFSGNYHGDTLFAMSAGKKCNYFKQFEDLMPEVIFIEYPSTWIDDLEVNIKEKKSINALKETILIHGDRVSSIIIEPIFQGASGMNYARIEFINEVVNICKDAGIIIIFDEVMTGFYRTGKMFAYEYLSNIPDILCLSKCLTGGFFPMGITSVNHNVYEAFYSDNTSHAFLHGHSYTANPIICEAANGSIELFCDDNFTAKPLQISNIYNKILPDLLSHKNIQKVRTHGAILAFDVKQNDEYLSQKSTDLKHKFLANGLNLRPIANTIYIIPPYVIDSNVLKESIYKILEII